MNPYQNASTGRKTRTLAGIYVSMIAMLMVSSGASTLLPEAAKEIGGETVYSMATTLQGVLSIVMMPLFGYIGAKRPALKPTMIAVSIFVGAAVLIARGLVNSMWAIIIPSFLLGFCSPAVYVTGFSLIRDMYDSKRAGVLLGVVGTIVALGMLIGSMVTGLIIEFFGWRAVQFIMGSLLVIGGLLSATGVRITKEEGETIAVEMGMFDLPGAIATAMLLAGVILSLSLTDYAPFGSAVNLLFIAIAAVGLVWLIFDIRKKKTGAFIPAPVLRDRNTLCLTLNNLLCNLSAMALYFFMPSYVIYVMELSPAYAGLVLSIHSIPGLFMGPIFGRLIGRAGSARNVSIFAQILRIGVHVAFILILSPTTSIYVVYALMFIGGFYASTGSVIPAAAPQIQIKPEVRQLGNSMVQLAQNLGASMSVAIYTMVISNLGMASGVRVACAVAAAFAVGALLVSFPLTKLETEETAQS